MLQVLLLVSLWLALGVLVGLNLVHHDVVVRDLLQLTGNKIQVTLNHYNYS